MNITQHWKLIKLGFLIQKQATREGAISHTFNKLSVSKLQDQICMCITTPIFKITLLYFPVMLFISFVKCAISRHLNYIRMKLLCFKVI